jgi:hypothetical protein
VLSVVCVRVLFIILPNEIPRSTLGRNVATYRVDALLVMLEFQLEILYQFEFLMHWFFSDKFTELGILAYRVDRKEICIQKVYNLVVLLTSDTLLQPINAFIDVNRKRNSISDIFLVPQQFPKLLMSIVNLRAKEPLLLKFYPIWQSVIH